MAGQEFERAANAQAAVFHHCGGWVLVRRICKVLQFREFPAPAAWDYALVGQMFVRFEQDFALGLGNTASKG